MFYKRQDRLCIGVVCRDFRQQTHILRQVFYEFSLAAVQKNGDLHAFVFERFQQSDKAALCPANLQRRQNKKQFFRFRFKRRLSLFL